MYEKFYRLGWLGMEGTPATRDNSSPYKQALSLEARGKTKLTVSRGNNNSMPEHDFISFKHCKCTANAS